MNRDADRIPMRVGLTVEWALAFREKILEAVRASLPELEQRWPLQGVAYQAFANDDWLLIILTPVAERAVPSGPAHPLPFQPEDVPPPDTAADFRRWEQSYRERHSLRAQDLLVLVPRPLDDGEDGGAGVDEQWERWTDKQRAVWDEALRVGFLQGLRALLAQPLVSTPTPADAPPVASAVYKTHPSFRPPVDCDQPLWRYMSLAKYLSLLTTTSLFFPRADHLGDPWEGALGQANARAAAEIYGEHAVRIAEARERIPVSVFVSCWHAQDFESAAMWAMYAGVDPSRSEGVAIRSTFRRLMESLSGPYEIYCGTVQYLDYDAEFIPEDNEFERFMRKRRSFEHEREVRAVLSVHGSDEVGIPVTSDVERLVDEVRVAPSAPGWFLEVATAVTVHYGLRRPVLQSGMDDPPVR